MGRHIHGGNIYPYETILDFSANLNPLGMPESVRQAAISGVQCSEHYPEPDCKRLRRMLGESLGISPEHIICGNGATELIFLAAAALRPKKALLLAPTYAEYEEAFSAYGCKCQYHLLRKENDFLPGEALLEAITPEFDVVAVCNPNNPTGLLLEQDFILDILGQCQRAGSMLLLDESFLELTGTESVGNRSKKSSILESEHLFLLKSMTKTYSMAGLRLGYAVGGSRLFMERMYQYKPSWNVSIPAQAAGEAALLERNYLEQSVCYIRKEREFLWKKLGAFPIQLYPGAANYLFFFSERGDLKEAFLKEEILIRDCGNYRGLKSGYYRIAVRTHEENERLLKAFERVFGRKE